MRFTKILNNTARVLVVVGALNWGLALWNVNLVTSMFATMPFLVKTIYALVGLSGVWEIVRAFK